MWPCYKPVQLQVKQIDLFLFFFPTLNSHLETSITAHILTCIRSTFSIWNGCRWYLMRTLPQIFFLHLIIIYFFFSFYFWDSKDSWLPLKPDLLLVHCFSCLSVLVFSFYSEKWTFKKTWQKRVYIIKEKAPGTSKRPDRQRKKSRKQKWLVRHWLMLGF